MTLPAIKQPVELLRDGKGVYEIGVADSVLLPPEAASERKILIGRLNQCCRKAWFLQIVARRKIKKAP